MNSTFANVWESAEFITEWTSTDLTYKLLSVPREAIDEDSDEADALLLIGLDSGGVRRVDVLIDTAYSRELSIDDIDAVWKASETAPSEHREELSHVKTFDSLMELTGKESGIAKYENESMVFNWSSIDGLPRLFVTGTLGLGGTIKATPVEVEDYMLEGIIAHEKEESPECDHSEISNLSAYEVCEEGTEAIVIISDLWN